MTERCASISADVRTAREKLTIGRRNDDGLALKLCRIEQEDDSITFVVDGYEGEFTAFPADPYPGGETTVYGPDELEFCHAGTVLQVVDHVLQKLGDRLARRTSLEEVPSPRQSETCPHENDDVDDEDWQEIVDDTPLEAKLQHDICQVRSMFGTDAASYAQLSLEAWRIRLGCPLVTCVSQVLPSSYNRGKTEPLLDETTASAWGLHATRQLVIELHIPAIGYLGPDMDPTAIVKSVWQEGNPKFALERQMVQILADYCVAALSPERHSQALFANSATSGSIEYSPEELEVLQRYQAKKLNMIRAAQDDLELGFLANLLRYARLRITTMHEYCAICDQPFAVQPMLLRTVCCRDLCTYQFGEFGDKITSAEGVNTQPEIVDLLVCMLMRAALSQRRDLILDPYPCVFGGEDGKEMIFHPKVKDNSRLQNTVKAILTLRQECGGSMGASWSALKSRMGTEATSLVSWVVASNRSYLAPLGDDQRIPSFQTPYQYLLISAPPDKEREFQALKKIHGSVFAYHGSPAENWHSILRNGLKNASDTKLMTTGKAYGPGIYLATDSQTSLHYAARGAGWSLANLGITLGARETDKTPDVKRQKTGNRFLTNVEELVMLAVCEVIDHSSLKRHGSIWVAPQESTVITRFFLVYTDPSKLPRVNTPISGLESQIRECMQKLRVGMVC